MFLNILANNIMYVYLQYADSDDIVHHIESVHIYAV